MTRMPFSFARAKRKLLFPFPGVRIQKEHAIVPDLREVEHLADRAGDCIKRTLADSRPTQPVVLDEPNDRRLVSHGVINKVRPRPRRDYQQRQTRPVSATSLSMNVRRTHTGQRVEAIPAEAGRGESISRS